MQELLDYYGENSEVINKISIIVDFIIKFIMTICGLTVLLSKIINFWNVTRWVILDKLITFIQAHSYTDLEDRAKNVLYKIRRKIIRLKDMITDNIIRPLKRLRLKATPFRFR